MTGFDAAQAAYDNELPPYLEDEEGYQEVGDDDYLYSILVERQWTDLEPDTLTISVETGMETGIAHTVFSGCATWLNNNQLAEVQAFLVECRELVDKHNQSL